MNSGERILRQKACCGVSEQNTKKVLDGIGFLVQLCCEEFQYSGILIFFYSNEHEPIHVHGKYDGFESKAEFYIIDGKIVEIKIKQIKGLKPLTGPKLKDFKDFLELYADKIVQKWIDYFVYHKDVKFEKINTKIK